MKRFNLIITCGRFMEFNASRELDSIFYLLGEENARIMRSGISGILLAKINIDPHIAVTRIRELISERPWDFRFTKRYIPVDRVVETDLEKIREAALELAKSIPSDASFRITVEKRYTDLRSKDIIDAIAPGIDRSVSLDQPDYILLIEVLGNVTGVSLIKPNEIVSVEKELLPE